MAEYRVLAPAEPPPIALWSETFHLEPSFFESVLGSEDVSLAAFEDGELVSSVHVYVREMRDRRGRPLRVGRVSNVCTRPDHRKRGHSGRLIERALEEMERRGCVWSLLATRVHKHYARYGWRTVSTPEPWGEIREDASGEAVDLTPDNATLRAMAALYDAGTEDRPLAMVRGPEAWRAIRYQISGRTLLLGAYDGDRLAAYVVAIRPWGHWAVVEAVGAPARFPGLFGALGARLRRRIDIYVQAHLPEGPAMDAFASMVERVGSGENRETMLRPIAGRISWPDLLALYGDPRGRPGDLDAF